MVPVLQTAWTDNVKRLVSNGLVGQVVISWAESCDRSTGSDGRMKEEMEYVQGPGFEKQKLQRL